MASALPRILTVDPEGNLAQQIDVMLNLMDRAYRHMEVPDAGAALEEIAISRYDVVISTWNSGMPGWQLAAEVKKQSAETSVILMADYDDIPLDEETREASPFVYLRRPIDVPQLARVLRAALDGEDIKAAQDDPGAGGGGGGLPDFGPVPDIDLEKTRSVMHNILNDVGALAALFINREGEVLIEQGTVGYIDKEDLAQMLIPAMVSAIELRDIVGGQSSALQYYDGAENDIYVLSVGFHYCVAVIFDGKNGARQLGAVSRYGRKHAEDIIGLLGANAWMIRRREEPKPTKEVARRSDIVQAASKTSADETEPVLLERGAITTMETEAVEVPVVEQLDAIPDDEFDLDALFGGSSAGSDIDDLFSLENMEELAKETGQGGKGLIDFDQAIEVGLIDN